MGEDPTTDLTGTDFTLYETEALNGSLANLDELISINGQVPPARGNVVDQPGELACLYNETDDLILSVVPADFVEFDDLPMVDGKTLLKIETNDLNITQGSGPNPADTNPGLISGDAIDTFVVLGELFPRFNENQEAAEEDTARNVVNKTVRREEEPQQSEEELTNEDERPHSKFPRSVRKV